MTTKIGPPFIHHSVCPQSGLQELWMLRLDKDGITEVLAGPERLPRGWVELYNLSNMEYKQQ